MELKNKLDKPYTENERLNFIVEENHNLGYEIRETETALEAWGLTEEEQAQKERERINQLSLTKREVFLALLNDKNITPDMIRAQIQSPQALIEFDYANDYFRGNPLIESIGGMLGYSSDDLDYLFEHKEFPPKTVEQEQEQEQEGE